MLVVESESLLDSSMETSEISFSEPCISCLGGTTSEFVVLDGGRGVVVESGKLLVRSSESEFIIALSELLDSCSYSSRSPNTSSAVCRVFRGKFVLNVLSE